MVFMTGIISIRVPNFAMFLDFSGAFSMTFLAFIMPVKSSVEFKFIGIDVSEKLSRKNWQSSSNSSLDPYCLWNFLWVH
jgi:hypothetical protein